MNSLSKLGIFGNIPAIQATGAASAIGAGQSGAAQNSSSNNPFRGNTVGVNNNIGVGDTSFLSAQAGKKAGMGRTLGFA